jgi:hypothetical protein
MKHHHILTAASLLLITTHASPSMAAVTITIAQQGPPCRRHPEPCWVCWSEVNPMLPVFTFRQPPGMSLQAAEDLKASADICCGGTLSVVAADE